MAFELDKLVRENVLQLVAYSSARSEFSGAAEIYLDANENSFGSPLGRDFNRYPDPLQIAIKSKLAEWESVSTGEIFVGNGSDEAIDLLIRIFCRPQLDNIVVCPPTYGMYEVAAGINDVAVKRANLSENFEIDLAAVKNAIDANTKIIFLCSPNNPTGNLLDRKSIIEITRLFDVIVVLDEAYIHFSGEQSFVNEISSMPNLIVLQTFSKAWGLAGLRVGLAFASEGIIELFNKIKPPYNVSQIAQEAILSALENRTDVEKTIVEIVKEREILAVKLNEFSFVEQVYPSSANFILLKIKDANAVYEFLLTKKIVVRNRSNVALCGGCLRITVGTSLENLALLQAIKNYETSLIY